MTRTHEAPLRYRPQPSWIPPMLATLADDPPANGGWIYEPKLDGVRVLIFASGGRVRLFSRNRKPLESAYPELVEALSIAVRGDAVLDGEVVAIDPRRGVSSFALLQQRMQLRDAARAARTGVSVML
jgi:bifunctional non-homologous end joining protein LigD